MAFFGECDVPDVSWVDDRTLLVKGQALDIHVDPMIDAW